MTLSEKLASFVVQTRFEDLPSDVVEFTKLCILDWLGSALAGADRPPAQMLHRLVQDLGGMEQSTLVTGGKTSVAYAALVNGGASHILELDDIHKSSIIHAGTVVIPTALAVAEWLNKSGKDLITAVVLGYDVCYRIGEAVSSSHYYFWHNTATCGTFGAAAAAAKLLELDEQQTIHALGNAGTQAAGLWEFIVDGAMTKQLHCGKAAMNGLLAALLAKGGFTGPRKILEGDRGFFKAMSQHADESRITEQLGQRYKITENSFKIHASCRHTHPAIDLALRFLKERPIPSHRIRKVRVGGYRSVIDVTDNANPDTVYASKFSLHYCTALAFVKGKAGLPDFNEDNLFDPEIRSFMKKVELFLDPEIDAAYPEKWGTSMEVETETGETIRLKTDFPKGDPENAVTKEELIDKFRILASRWPEAEAERFASYILSMEASKNAAEFWGA